MTVWRMSASSFSCLRVGVSRRCSVDRYEEGRRMGLGRERGWERGSDVYGSESCRWILIGLI